MGIYDLMQGIQQQGEQGRQQGLQRLIGTAYNAPREQRQQILGTVAQRGAPGAAFDAEAHFGKMDEQGRAELGRYAAAFVNLPDDQKAQVYPELVKRAQSVGIPVPDGQYQPQFADGIGKLAQAFGGAQGRGRLHPVTRIAAVRRKRKPDCIRAVCP